jgi:hypothetical protein
MSKRDTVQKVLNDWRLNSVSMIDAVRRLVMLGFNAEQAWDKISRT